MPQEAGSSSIATPSAGDQISGLNFAVLLISSDLTIREVNPAAENLIGRSSKRLVGFPMMELLHFGDALVRQRLFDGDAQLTARNVPLQAAQRQLNVDLTVSALPAHKGWRVFTLSIAGKDETLGDEDRDGIFRGPAVLAHEIKNPLSAIKGAAQLLARKVGDDEKAFTSLIADEVDRIAQLVDRMQRLGRETVEPVTSVNLHEAIRSACATISAASVSAALPARFNLHEQFDPSLPRVKVNEGALVQVLVNLLSNAREACAERQSPAITIRTRFVSGLATNVFRLGRPTKLPIEVCVSDNGFGIDPSLANHIFEPFVSGKKNGQGLGLALVYKLVRDMDGRISHERDEAAGQTHFRIHLPMAE